MCGVLCQYRRDLDILERVTEEQDYVSYAKRLRDLRQFSQRRGISGGISPMNVKESMNTCRENAKMEPGSFHWCPVPGQEAVSINSEIPSEQQESVWG